MSVYISSETFDINWKRYDSVTCPTDDAHIFPSESVRSLTLLMEHSTVKLQMSSKLLKGECSPPKSDLLQAN